MKAIQINLWDDYHQKPEHEWNDTTHLTIEKGIEGDSSILLLREELFKKCLQWKKKFSKMFSKVKFSRSIQKNIIDIIELDRDSRHDLYGYLKKNFTKWEDSKIEMLMES